MKKSLIDKQAVIRNFSKAARTYDKYADIQKQAARELVSRIPENGFCNILEIGCGTGIYTRLLRERFPCASLKAVDISCEMVKVAKARLKDAKIAFIVADAEKALSGSAYDLITSNACFQWFEDLQKALLKYRDKLKSGGMLSFTVFGPKTFWELSEVFKTAFPDTRLAAAQFDSQEKLNSLLEKDFKDVAIDEIRYCEKFDSLRDLLEKIKHTGTSGHGNEFLGPKCFKDLEKVYQEKFGRIQATHQVFFCHCHKP
ncbi:MAG: malonyl-ACP O-methyltransferase BioC [Candidatus Omnitrophota bacterium]